MFSFRCHHIILRNSLTISAYKNISLLESPSPISTTSSSICTTIPKFESVSHYEALGISTDATQNDIKAAYYKLSMTYHPDKNKGCEEAANKFRDISAAYEVLGNYRLKKLYDKGIIHTAGPQFARPVQEEPEDDPQTKFYKSRMRNKTPTATGRTPIYDFDEWAKAHYGSSFERKKAAKTRFDAKERESKDNSLEIQKEFLLFGFILGLVCFIIVGCTEASYDSNKVTNTKNSNNSKD